MRQRREMAVDEGARVNLLALRLFLEQLGARKTHELAKRLGKLEVDNPLDYKARENLSAMLSAATAHVEDVPDDDDLSDWEVEHGWREARQVGARAFAMTLRVALDAYGPAEMQRLSTAMDAISVEGADVSGVREILGLPPLTGPGTMQDWVDFLGTAWTMLADEGADWEWAEISESRSVMRVRRCPYWAAMTDEVRAGAPCEAGCSGYVDTAAQLINPSMRLRGDPEAAEQHLGYANSAPKGDAYCDLEVAFVD